MRKTEHGNNKQIFFGCGFNVNHQITFTETDEILHSCQLPVPVSFITWPVIAENLDKCVQISSSHILWKVGNEWKLSGHKTGYHDDIFTSAKSSSMVRSCEKRIAFIQPNGDVMVSSRTSTKKLNFQTIKTEEQIFKKMEGNIEVSDIAIEDNCLLCISKEGKLYTSEIEVLLPGIRIDQVSVGKEHCLALTTNRKVLSWGSGMRGQLGNGEIGQVDEPAAVVALDGLEIMSIASGGWHSAALSSSGDVYVWGWNDVGQLGLPSRMLRSDGVKWDDILEDTLHNLAQHLERKGETRETENEREDSCRALINPNGCTETINVQASPKLLDFWTLGSYVKKVACGDRHTVFLLSNGTAWTTGWNMYGQLGIGSFSSVDEPHVVPLNSVEDIFAGGWNSVFVAASPQNPR